MYVFLKKVTDFQYWGGETWENVVGARLVQQPRQPIRWLVQEWPDAWKCHVMKLDKKEKSQNTIINKQQQTHSRWLAHQMASNRRIVWRKEAAGQSDSVCMLLSSKEPAAISNAWWSQTVTKVSTGAFPPQGDWMRYKWKEDTLCLSS